MHKPPPATSLRRHRFIGLPSPSVSIVHARRSGCPCSYLTPAPFTHWPPFRLSCSMQFPQSRQSGAYWSCTAASFIHSFISLHEQLTHSPGGWYCSHHTMPAPRQYTSTLTQLHSTTFRHSVILAALHYQRLHIICPPPAGRPVLYHFIFWHYVQYGSAAACGCFRSYLSSSPRVQGGMAVVADAPHFHSSYRGRAFSNKYLSVKISSLHQ